MTDINGREIALGGDVIEKIDNNTVRKIDYILVYLESVKSIGDTVSLSVLRNGQLHKLNLTLAEGLIRRSLLDFRFFLVVFQKWFYQLT